MNTAHPPDLKPLDLDDLIARIREETRKQDHASPYGADPQQPGLESPFPQEPASYFGLFAQKQEPVSYFGSFAQKEAYRLRDFLAVPEANFLAYAYQAILKRTPNEADYRFYRTGLYAGGNRAFVLASILWSEEAQRHRVRVRGLRWTALFKPLPGKRLLKPVLGAWERLTCAFDLGLDLVVELNELRRRLEEFHQDLYQNLHQALQERDCYSMQFKRRLEHLQHQACQTASRLDAVAPQTCAGVADRGGASATEDPGPAQVAPSEIPEPEPTQQDLAREAATPRTPGGGSGHDIKIRKSDLIA